MIAGVALLLVAGIIVYIFLCVICHIHCNTLCFLFVLLQYIGYRLYHCHDSRSSPAVSGGHHRLHLPLCHIHCNTLCFITVHWVSPSSSSTSSSVSSFIYIVTLSALLQYIGYRLYHCRDSRSSPAVSGGHHRLHLPLCHIYIVILSALLQYIGYRLYHCYDSRSGPAVSGGHHRLHLPLCHLSYTL